MSKKRLIVLLIIIVGVWYFWGRSRVVDGPARESAKVENSTSPQPSPNLGEEENRGEVGDGQVRVHYFTKVALAECSMETVVLEQTADPKYGHRAAGALVAMTLALPAEVREQYVSALSLATRLLSMRIDDEGAAMADYNSALDDALTSCAKDQRRAQIERTLKEFPEIKSVVVTVNGEVWE